MAILGDLAVNSNDRGNDGSLDRRYPRFRPDDRRRCAERHHYWSDHRRANDLDRGIISNPRFILTKPREHILYLEGGDYSPVISSWISRALSREIGFPLAAFRMKSLSLFSVRVTAGASSSFSTWTFARSFVKISAA
jgi:hypothetical protein